MGVVFPKPSKNSITSTMDGKNASFIEGAVVPVRVSDEGFHPEELVLYQGQSISFEWNVDSSSKGFRIFQVCGTELNRVPGGYNSGDLTSDRSFKVYFGRKGQFTFISESKEHSFVILPFKVQVVEKPMNIIKITDEGFEKMLVNIEEGETVQWSCEYGDSKALSCSIQEMEFCFKHAGFVPKTSRITVYSTHEMKFQDTGLFYFYLDKHDTGTDWLNDQGNLICAVRVTQVNREFSVHLSDEGLNTSMISARVQDRIWLDCPNNRTHARKILDACIYKDTLANPLVSAQLFAGSARIAELVSYQFVEPGLYHYMYNMADLSQFRGCVVVQPKPREHVVNIVDGQFRPALLTINEKDRIWWTWNNSQGLSFILKELNCCTPLTRRKSLCLGCDCKELSDQVDFVQQLGLMTHKFDSIGEFSFHLVPKDDQSFPSTCCSVVVQTTSKHYSVKVCDGRFTPKILNVHPGDWVWWQWSDTKRPHNIKQVSHQWISQASGFDSGKATKAASAFTNVFQDLGIFYFASNGIPEMLGAVVVTPSSKLHIADVTAEGIRPDLLVVSVNACVTWVWSDGTCCNLQEISQQGEVQGTLQPSHRVHFKRCHTRLFGKAGMYHFLCSGCHDSESEVHSQRSDTFIHSVLVDPVPYSCRVGVTAAEGFKPSVLTIEKSQCILWTWENQENEEHNIIHVRPPQAKELPLSRVVGLSAFNSGQMTTRSTFFHTFDVAGTYFISSEGTDGHLCRVEVLEKAAHVGPPGIPAGKKDGGNVECGYQVFLECETEEVEICYTLDGSYPAEYNSKLMHYSEKKGIFLAQAGFFVIRAVAKKEGCVTSSVYTSKRFWVIKSDDVVQEDMIDEESEQEQGTGSEEVDLKEEIFKWHWLSCRPSITVELVCDNTFNINVTLGNAADLSWIKGFQLFLNGQHYGGWFGPHCRGLVVSGMIGGKVYHVVLAAYPTQESFEPQLSNEVVISCPLQTLSGGPVVSLEAATSPQSLVIVWPIFCDPNTADIVSYSVIINDQPFGEQVIPESESDYCRVVFESSLQDQTYSLCVASHSPGSDVLLYSNEVEFSLPIPEEILGALRKTTTENYFEEGEEIQDGEAARELLLVAEQVTSESCVTVQSAGNEELSLKSLISKLQTIPEDQPLIALAAEPDADVEQRVSSQEMDHVQTMSVDNESLHRLEEQEKVAGDGLVPLGDKEADVKDAPADLSSAQVKDETCTAVNVELDSTIFRYLGGSCRGTELSAESLTDSIEDNKRVRQLHEEYIDEATTSQSNAKSDIPAHVVFSELKDDVIVNQSVEHDHKLTIEQASEQYEVTQETLVNREVERTEFMDNDKKPSEIIEQTSSRETSADLWDQSEKKGEEDTTTNENFSAKRDKFNSHAMSHVASQGSTDHNKAGDNGAQGIWDNDKPEVESRTELDQDIVRDDIHFNDLRHDAFIAQSQRSEVGETAYDSPEKVVCGLSELDASDEIEESQDSATEIEDENVRGANSERGECLEKGILPDYLAQLILGRERSAQPVKATELKNGYQQDERDYLESKGIQLQNSSHEEANGKRKNENLQEELIAAAVEVLQDSLNSFTQVEDRAISMSKGKDEVEGPNNERLKECTNSEKVVCGENQLADLTPQETNCVTLSSKHAGDGNNVRFEVVDDIWSALSSNGSVKNDNDRIMTVALETTEMPTFEESSVVDDPMFALNSNQDDVDFQLESENRESNMKGEEAKDRFQGEVLETSYDKNSANGSEHLPRPLLVIKGTTPTAVTLEWEWTLQPKQIAGADIVYSVFSLGRKFHSDINSNFCFKFEDSPVKTMWPNEIANLKQHAWRTTGRVIEITGLRQRCSYRLAVLGQLMPCAGESLSHVISFTMPGAPKSPVLHVRDLQDRQVTLTWKPSTSFGDATVVGYRLLKDGKAFREDLASETLSLCLAGLEEGIIHNFSLIAVTGHNVGDSKPSNTIIVHCPTVPESPEIYIIESSTWGSICIAWKRNEPVNSSYSEKHAQYSYCVYVDGVLHGECALDDVTDIFSDEHTYTITDCTFERKYRLSVRKYLNPDVVTGEDKNKVYVCGCYGESSNILEVYCAGPPSPPVPRVSRIDQSGVTLSWSRSREYGGVALAGYILHVNGKWSTELFSPEQKETKLTGFRLGEVIRVQMAAVTSDRGVPISEIVNQEVNKPHFFPSSVELLDSGVESSSSFLSKGSVDHSKQLSRSLGPPLLIQYSNLVRQISSFGLTNVCCRSVSITWSLDFTASCSVDPEILNAVCWKTTEQRTSVMRHRIEEKPFRIKGLEPGMEYYVMLECFAAHVNDDSSNEQPINRTQSQPISFKTGIAPGPLTNIYVVSATEQSIKLAWKAPVEHDVPAAMILVNVKMTNQHSTDQGVDFHVSPNSNVFDFEHLAPRTLYTFTLKVLTKDDIFDIPEGGSTSVASFCASTNGVDVADKLKLTSRSPTSLAIKWQSAVAYGLSIIRHHIVHYVENRQQRKRSRGKVVQEAETVNDFLVESERCEAVLRRLEPGSVYRIIVQTVEGIMDYSYEEDFDSDHSDTNSTNSSAPSEKPADLQRIYLSEPLLVSTTAPPESPVLMVSSFTATQIHLSWNRPLVLSPVTDDEEIPCGRVRHLKGFRVQMNGRVFTRLTADKKNITIKKCKSGMKYTCVVVAMTCPEMFGCQQRKSEPSDSTISGTDTDEDDIKSSLYCFEESASDPVEVTLPRQDWGVCLRVDYCASRPDSSLGSSTCSETGDEEGGVVARWNLMSDVAVYTSGYRLVWYCSTLEYRMEVFLPGNVNEYGIWSVSPSAVYTIYLELLDETKEAKAVFGPVHCQTPGPPASPWIWCRTLSPYQITIEWNEPVTYGDVCIRGYQVYLNGRRLEKLVDRTQRRVTIHCQSSCVYRVSLVALGSDPQYGDSPPSNVLKLCTPVAQDSLMRRRPSGGVRRPSLDFTVNVLSTSNTSISFEWTHPPEILDTADHYVIKWSSVLQPQAQELTLPLTRTCHVIEDCSPGTNHFLVVAAVNASGGLVSRSEQYSLQTLAPVQQPVLKLRFCRQASITIEWSKPATFGDAEIDHYELMVNSKSEAQLDVECSEYKFNTCDPCQVYTFVLKALSTKPTCDSSWSEPLVVTCPGSEKPQITRIQSQQVNCISLGWKPPLLKGGAVLDSYKVYYLEDNGELVTSEDLKTNKETIKHGPLPSQTEKDELLPVSPDRYYWVMLQLELLPEDCREVCSEPIKTRAAVSPDPPLISVEVECLDKRRRLEKIICELTYKRDRLQRMVNLLENSIVVKGSKEKDDKIAEATNSILEIHSELSDALKDIKEFTGSVSTLIRWSRPRDDGDAVVSGYQVFVDGFRYGKILSQWSLETRLKLSVDCHVIAVQTLTDHPVGPSSLSNAVSLSGREFDPFVLFCYFDVHKRGESWSIHGCCDWDDSHSFEHKHRSQSSGRVFIPRGILARRIPCPVFSVMDVFSALWRPVATLGLNRMVALLFWTKWCFSSLKVMEYFVRFAEEFKDEFSFVACCVRSEEPIASHRQALADILTERGWHKGGNCVTHTCGCHSQSKRNRSARRGASSSPDVCQLFGLVGTPTLFLLDTSSYISWHGRCSCQDASSFRLFLLHIFSQVSQTLCRVSSCKYCESDREYEQETNSSDDEKNAENIAGQQHRESSELKFLHQRLHGTKSDSASSGTLLVPAGYKKERARPKTTTAFGRFASSSSYNSLRGFVEPYKSYPRSFSARGFIHSSNQYDSGGSESLARKHRSGTPQTSNQSPSGKLALPVISRQRIKRSHPHDRGSTPKVKTKISIDDFDLC